LDSTTKKNALVLSIVVLVVAAMIYTGAYRSRRQGPLGPESAVQAGLTGQMAPDFELKTLDGRSVRLSDFRGKAVLLNFWATWCGPCKIEMPWFVEFRNKYAADGFEILGVTTEDTGNESIRKFADEMGVNYVILRGTESVERLYGGVLGLPQSFYIGRDGRIVEQHAGLVSKSDIEDHIRLALRTGKE
jgi:peroxiredoxin